MKFNCKTWKQRQFLSVSGFVPHIAPPPLSRDRKMKMKKSTNPSKHRKGLKHRKGRQRTYQTPQKNDKGLQIDLLNIAKNDKGLEIIP